jgi:hypothetical protein
MSDSRVQSIRATPGVFLAKMRLGTSNIVLATIFHIKSKRAISMIIHEVSRALMEEFAPKYIGYEHISREHVLRHYQTAIATELMAKRKDQVILVMGGTYLFVQKSSDNEFQRQSFSMHKHRNLVKPMIITATVSIESQLVVNKYP